MAFCSFGGSLMQENQDFLVSYESFIFNHQFQRKIPIGWHFFSRSGTIAILILLCSYLFLPVEYKQYGILLGFYYFLQSYVKTKLLFLSKISFSDKNTWDDEKNKTLLLFSKLSWAQKIHYNRLNKKRKKEKREHL